MTKSWPWLVIDFLELEKQFHHQQYGNNIEVSVLNSYEKARQDLIVAAENQLAIESRQKEVRTQKARERGIKNEN